VHDPEICILDRVVGIEGVRDPMLAVIVCTSSYLDFISYAVMLTSLCTIGLDRRRLSSCIASWIWGGVPRDVGSVGCIVGGIASSIGRGVCWSISRRVGWSIGCSIGSGIGRLHYFIFTSTFFGHPGYDVAGKDALICFRSKNLLRVCCIRDLFLRSEQWRRGRLLENVRPLKNLRGGSERQEQLPSSFVVNCRL
jgi:hypothetical protein